MPGNAEDLEIAETQLWAGILDHLSASKRWQDYIKLVLVLGGGALAGLSQVPLPWPDYVKIILGVLGSAMAVVGGFLLIKIEKGFLDTVVEARSTLVMWRRALGATEAIEASRQRVQTALEAEQALTVSFDNMIQFLENALSIPRASLEERLDLFVASTGPTLVDPLQLGLASDWTISIFLKKTENGEDVMVRSASHWKDPSASLRDPRRWRRGKGWTGQAWMKGEETPRNPYVVEVDASTAEARARYDTDNQDKDEDVRNFKSVVAIPLRLRGDHDVFGVVVATSSLVGTFGMAIGTPPRRNFDTLRSFSLLIAALAASE